MTRIRQATSALVLLCLLAGCSAPSNSGTPNQSSSNEPTSTLVSDCNKLVPLVDQGADGIRILNNIIELRSENRYEAFAEEQFKVGTRMDSLSIEDPTLADGVKQMASALKSFQNAAGLDLSSKDSALQFADLVGASLDQYQLALGKLRDCSK